VLSGIPGTGKVRIIRKRWPRTTPVAGPAPILHICGFQLGIVVVGDVPLVRETMGMPIEMTQVHLPDIEVHELTFLRKQWHQVLLGLERVVGVLLARRNVLSVIKETRLSLGPFHRLSSRSL
jgi:hypothetical protein